MGKRGVINYAKVIQVIEVSTVKGEGVEEDPVRSVIEYWSLDGNLLAERDTWLRTETIKEAPDV